MSSSSPSSMTSRLYLLNAQTYRYHFVGIEPQPTVHQGY